MIDIENLRVNIESKVLSSGKVILVPHKLADFDAIGSALGLSLAVRKLKKTSFIIIDDKKYDLDRGVQTIVMDTKNDFGIINRAKYMQMADKDDLFIMTDVNKSYLVPIADLMTRPEKVIIIDHHEPDDKTVPSDADFIDSKVSSASEVIVGLLSRMKIKIPKNIANYLLAGIYLDTNKMTKSNISLETSRAYTKLLESGASVGFVMNMFREDFDSDRRVQELVSKTRMITLRIAMMLADPSAEYTKKELARTADYGLNYECDASFAIGRLNDETIGISARSSDKIDVGQVMRDITEGKGGGGHQFSGAAEIKNSSIEEVGKKLELLLRPNCYKEKSTEE